MKKHKSAVIFLVSSLAALAVGISVVIGVSQSARAETVPDVSHQSLETAKSALEAQGIEIETMFVSSPQAAGTVVKQEPEAGTTIRKGQKVRLFIVLNNGAVSSTAPSPATSESPVEQAQQEPGPAPQTNKGTQQNNQQTPAQRKAEIARQIAEANAAAAAAKQKAADELARIAAEQARVDALYNAMVAAQAEVQAARYAVDRAEYSVNDFANRGMLQSGSGAQAVQARADAQVRLDNATAAAQAATDAWNAR